MADFSVGSKPVQVVPDAGCRAEVISQGATVWYGASEGLDPETVIGKLEHGESMVIDDPMWFMSGTDARLHVVQLRFCRRCGWVDGS